MAEVLEGCDEASGIGLHIRECCKDVMRHEGSALTDQEILEIYPTSLILEVHLNLQYHSSSRLILKAIEISTMKGGERKKKLDK